MTEDRHAAHDVDELFDRLETLRERLGEGMAHARRAIEMTRRLQESDSVNRIAAMQRLRAANEAMQESAQLVR